MLGKVIDAARDDTRLRCAEFDVTESTVAPRPVRIELTRIGLTLAIEVFDHSTAQARLTRDPEGGLNLEVDHDRHIAMRVEEAEPPIGATLPDRGAAYATDPGHRASVLAALNEQLKKGVRYKLRLRVEAEPGGDWSAGGAVTFPRVSAIDLPGPVDDARVVQPDAAHDEQQRDPAQFADFFRLVVEHALIGADQPQG